MARGAYMVYYHVGKQWAGISRADTVRLSQGPHRTGVWSDQPWEWSRVAQRGCWNRRTELVVGDYWLDFAVAPDQGVFDI